MRLATANELGEENKNIVRNLARIRNYTLALGISCLALQTEVSIPALADASLYFGLGVAAFSEICRVGLCIEAQKYQIELPLIAEFDSLGLAYDVPELSPILATAGLE